MQPIEFYDWSIPRDVYQQIYRAITTQKVTTFTDGTWVLFVDEEAGVLYPVYSEHKCTAFPFIMERTEKGEWKRVSKKPPQFTINIRNKPKQ